MTEHNGCRYCKNLYVIVSQISDYWCSEKNEYKSIFEFCKNCDNFIEDTETLEEKEDRIW